MKPMGRKYAELCEQLEQLVENEHVCGCGQDSCDINASFTHGFTLWSIVLFSSSGAASKEFETLFRKLPKRFNADAERERKMFIETVAHDACPNCGAVVWHDDGHGSTIHCDNCAMGFDVETKEVV